MEWKPASIQEVEEILQEDLPQCDAEQMALFEMYSIPPYPAPIVRYDNLEGVVVVAKKGNQVIYWEDVEEGFNVSEIDETGLILEHWCNEDDLGQAIDRWIEEESIVRQSATTEIG